MRSNSLREWQSRSAAERRIRTAARDNQNMGQDAIDSIRILGPLEVVANGRRVAVAGERQRLLLAMLSLRANRVVTVDELVDALSQRGGTGALHTAISRLRRVVGGERIETHPSGYALRADAGQLDALAARQAAERAAEQADVRDRAGALANAEALWRGPVLAGMDLPASFRADAERLDELRRAVVAQRIEAELELGRHADLVGELDSLTQANAFDERLHRARALALYRSGRQAEALAALAEYRSTLRDELGLEPSGELRALEHAILNHDPALLPAEPAPISDVVAKPTWRLRRWLIAAALACAAAATVVVVAVVRPGSDGVAMTDLQPGTLAVVPLGSARAQRTYGVGPVPRAIAVGFGAAWVADFTNQTLARVEKDGLVETIGLGVSPTRVAVGAGAVWVVAGHQGWLLRLEPSSGRVLNRIRLRPGLADVAAAAGSVWVTNSELGTLTRIAASRSEPDKTISGFAGPTGVVVARGSVWVAERRGRRLARVDARRAAVMDRVPLDLPPNDLAVSPGAVWATNHGAGAVTRVDVRSRTTRVTSVGRFPTTVVADANKVYVLNEFEHSVSRIDARTGEVVQTLALSNPETGRPRQITPGDIAVDASDLWLTVRSY
jgi:DNA-binding SARP family transcriptional activator/streptogramin lyase